MPSWRATCWAVATISARMSASLALSVAADSMCRRGTMSTCVGAPGLTSRKAYVPSDEATSSDGTSPAMILQNKQSVIEPRRYDCSGRPASAEAALGLRQLAAGIRVQVLELARLDAGVGDEVVDLVLLQADDPPELVGRDLTFVDQPVQRPDRDPQPACRLARAHPMDIDGGHAGIISTPPHVQWDGMKRSDRPNLASCFYGCLC